MEKLTRDLIYALKLNPHKCGTYQGIVSNFMSEQTMTPVENYTPDLIRQISENKMVDFLRTADNPAGIIWDYFNRRSLHVWRKSLSDTDALLATLSFVRVKNPSGEFVNGFWE